MAYQVLARKWRPQKFSEVIGQQPVCVTLQNSISEGRIGHAYLFSGPRGTGKTSTARIFAKAINCEKGSLPEPCNECSICREITAGTSVDVIEIDGASNRGIEEIRNLKENIKNAPFRNRYKVYIIDEVHMLTEHAFNALLKTLEEPPAHVVFIFATTEPFRIIPTILSRCQRFNLRRLSIEEITSHLKKIVAEEKFNIEDDALFLIAKSVEGSLRDAEGLLDQMVSYGTGQIKSENIADLLGIVDSAVFSEIDEAIISSDIQRGLTVIKKLADSGVDLRHFCRQWLEHFRYLLLAKIEPDVKALIDLTPENLQRVGVSAAKFTEEQIRRIIYFLSELEGEMRRTSQPRLWLEITFIRLARANDTVPLTELIGRLEEIEQWLGSGNFAQIPSTPRPQAAKTVPQAEKAVAKPEETKPVPAAENGKPVLTIDDVIEIPREQAELNMDIVLGLWPELLEIVRGKKMALHSVLIDTEPAALSGNTLTVKVRSEYHREALERKDNLSILASAMTVVFKRQLRLKTVLAPAEKKIPAGAENSTAPSPAPSSNDAPPKTEPIDPSIESVRKFFDGRFLKKDEK